MLVKRERVELDDVTLDCALYGPSTGPLALCLHGFPDSAHTFRYLAPHLVSLGYRVVVPAMRGYAPSSTSSKDDYQLAALAHDAIGLHNYFDGSKDALLVGHDWKPPPPISRPRRNLCDGFAQ